MNYKNNNKLKIKSVLNFIIPSLIGIVLFMLPIKYQGEITIPVAILAQLLLSLIQDRVSLIILLVSSLGFFMTFFISLIKPKKLIRNKFFYSLFYKSTFQVIIRFIGTLFIFLTYIKADISIITSGATGGLLLDDLLPTLFTIFLFAGIFLPLLLDFGLLEFFGILLNKIVRPLFTLPGRSSIDSIASWLGDGSIGVILTSKQYEEGYYSEREACVIGTNFSAVSITFSLVIISSVGLSNLFVPFYLTVTFIGIVTAMILPRIPPLSRKPDNYYKNNEQDLDDVVPKGFNTFSWALNRAVNKAENNPLNIKQFLKSGIKNVLDMWLGVIPMVMAIGTAALILAEYTAIFRYLGMPFIPLLNFLKVPEAALASETLVVGFADMFLPTVIGATIKSDMTRFIIAVISVTQLIYMSEVGGLLLSSKIPIKFKDLVIIFLQRTLISLPLVALIARFIIFA
ncbi:MAG: YjiH family protein [Clostridium sp.]|nr:YjiH family protein [Clostridium sp.]